MKNKILSVSLPPDRTDLDSYIRSVKLAIGEEVLKYGSEVMVYSHVKDGFLRIFFSYDVKSETNLEEILRE